MTSPQTPAGWYPDPGGGPQQRYWDGARWTEHYAAPAGGPAAYPGAMPPVAATTKPKPSPAPSIWWLMVPLALLALIGAAGPWVSASLGGETINDTNGLEGDGWFTVVALIGAVALLIVWRAFGERWSAITAAGVAALGALFPLIYMIDPSFGAEGFLVGQAEFSSGWGTYVAFVGCLALAALSAVLATRDRRANTPA